MGDQTGLLRVWNHHPGTGRLHIAHCLDHFCQEVYGLRSFVTLDPNTVLPCEEEKVFPARYYGPDRVAVYEDGSLKRRDNPPSTNIKGNLSGTCQVPSPGYEWRILGRAMNDHGWQRYIGPKYLEGYTPAFNCLPERP